MVVVLGQLAKGSGLLQFGHPELPFRIQRHNETECCSFNYLKLASHTVPRRNGQYVLRKRCGGKGVRSVGRNHRQLSFEDEPTTELFWLTLIKDAFWAVKSLVEFLVEQPSQLKYIEWPSFQSTLRTATLSLILVAFFIVALSSVDSALCYILALVLRRTP